VRIGLFTDSLQHLGLESLLDWLDRELPSVKDLEVATGGYSPTPRCDPQALVADAGERARWLGSIESRGFHLAALNVSGNPLEVEAHDRDLRATIELAELLGVDRVVCMSGGDARLVGGGWFPEIERRLEEYWREVVLPYWDAIAAEAARTPGLRLCLELEPGAVVYNVSTFERIAEGHDSLAVNLDPSHLFWQSMDPLEVVSRLGTRIGWVHGKDTVVDLSRVAVDGTLDRGSWRFATVGDGHPVDWWSALVRELAATGYDRVVSVEHEDASRPAEASVVLAAQALSETIG